jgi:nitrogenase molybdenum-iron protein alpha/beta subunit
MIFISIMPDAIRQKDSRDCLNPLWPCAMTGATACLAGFEDLGVVVHGSSGCYFYPSTLLNAPIHGTFLVENEIIFGTEERLSEVLTGISGQYERIAVVNTCVPAIMGEDIRSLCEEHNVLLVDSPGFLGDFESGYRAGLAALSPAVDPDTEGVNIDGIAITDPFFRGNLMEIERLLGLAGTRAAAVFCSGRSDSVYHAAPLTVSANPDIASNVGRLCGTMLGLDGVAETFDTLAACSEIMIDPIRSEIARAEKAIAKACDKYLRRFDPPRVAVFGGSSYAAFAAATLERYLDADIACVGSRNPVGPSRFPVVQVTDFGRIREMIRDGTPDLILGSSYERSMLPSAAFVGLTPPLRGKVLLRSRPLAGIEGTLHLMDEVLNACMDQQSASL